MKRFVFATDLHGDMQDAGAVGALLKFCDMWKPQMDEATRKYLSGIGSKGGKATGSSKRRGDAAYYKRISKKAAQARKRKAAKR